MMAVGIFLWERVNSAASDVESSAIAGAADTTAGVAVVDRVRFTATQLGGPLNGQFDSVSIDLVLNNDDPTLSLLNATVRTASVNTGDGQIDSTVVTADWFASDQYPEALFRSTGIERVADENSAETYAVSGNLTIRDSSQSVSFLLVVEDGTASGELPIIRQDFGIGDGGQDEFIESEVLIRFETSAGAQP